MTHEQKDEVLAITHGTVNRNTHAQIKHVVNGRRELMTPPEPPQRPIGVVSLEEKGEEQT